MESSNINYFARSTCQIAGVETSSGTYRPLKQTDFDGVFDFSGSISNISGSEYSMSNPNFTSIGFHVNMPSGAKIGFYGSFDGSSFTPITMRQIADDGYTKIATYHSQQDGGERDYIGSIGMLKTVSFRVLQTGVTSSPFTVAGRMITTVTTLEGIENSAAPHQFGHRPFHKGFYVINSTVSGFSIYQPPSGSKFAVTDVDLSIQSNLGTNVTLHEEINVNDLEHWVYTAFVNTAANDSKQISLSFAVPYVSEHVDSSLKLTVSDTAIVRGTVHGYYLY